MNHRTRFKVIVLIRWSITSCHLLIIINYLSSTHLTLNAKNQRLWAKSWLIWNRNHTNPTRQTSYPCSSEGSDSITISFTLIIPYKKACMVSWSPWARQQSWLFHGSDTKAVQNCRKGAYKLFVWFRCNRIIIVRLKMNFIENISINGIASS
jgi:hypothetical protein